LFLLIFILFEMWVVVYVASSIGFYFIYCRVKLNVELKL